ncbi:BOLA class I histocompatibility antigen, alpha chain BL3-6-like [Hemibagrus wyckioides]|uniref:BOLA class I histocompatibility antigen, alpha chain BL3-6-like n=1 Tax=Hemibagrus wyckioides TaxID=337641 RepID=UPI00266C9582|nr:BOLA class I histocompatibility antigen, alpha chain BL3-6-like [Hemibagrus wyckioides]
MEGYSVLMKVLLFLSFSLRSSSNTHCLQFLYTAVTPGINFPEFTAVGLLDEEQCVYYDSNIRKMIPETEWIKKIDADDPDYWNRETAKQQDEQDTFKSYLSYIMQSLTKSEGVHTLQRMYGCELHDDSSTRGYDQFGYDGEDFISLNLKTGTWTADNDKAEVMKKEWDNVPGFIPCQRNYLEKECIEWLERFVSYGRETLERKDPPTASVFQKHSPSPEVVCHATGFFPKEVMISWRKDGEDVNEDVELRETLPNQDGSFQKRSILKVPAEDLQKHTYTCVIQHSSLKEELVLEVPKGPDQLHIQYKQ